MQPVDSDSRAKQFLSKLVAPDVTFAFLFFVCKLLSFIKTMQLFSNVESSIQNYF